MIVSFLAIILFIFARFGSAAALLINPSPTTGSSPLARRTVDALNPTSFPQASQRDNTATRAFSSIEIKTSDGQCLFINELSGDSVADNTPVQIGNCDGDSSQLWDIITAGIHDNVPGMMLVVNTETQHCLTYDDNAPAGQHIFLYSCGGRSDGQGTTQNNQLFPFTGTATTVSLKPMESQSTCLAVDGDIVDVASCDEDSSQSFTYVNPSSTSSSTSGGGNGGGNSGTGTGTGTNSDTGSNTGNNGSSNTGGNGPDGNSKSSSVGDGAPAPPTGSQGPVSKSGSVSPTSPASSASVSQSPQFLTILSVSTEVDGQLATNIITVPNPSYTPIPSAAAQEAAHKSKTKIGIIVGAVIGALALLGLALCIFVLLRRRANKRKHLSPSAYMVQLAGGGIPVPPSPRLSTFKAPLPPTPPPPATPTTPSLTTETPTAISTSLSPTDMDIYGDDDDPMSPLSPTAMTDPLSHLSMRFSTPFPLPLLSVHAAAHPSPNSLIVAPPSSVPTEEPDDLDTARQEINRLRAELQAREQQDVHWAIMMAREPPPVYERPPSSNSGSLDGSLRPRDIPDTPPPPLTPIPGPSARFSA